MALLPDDEGFLRAKGFAFEILPPVGNDQLLVLRSVRLATGKFDHDQVDVLIKLPPGYPVTVLDMFWVYPRLRNANGSSPPAADTLEAIGDRTWQRFSRHLPGGAWRPGTDSLRTYLPRVLVELTQA